MNPPEQIQIDDKIGPVTTLPDGRLVMCTSDEDIMDHPERERPEYWAYLRFSGDSGRTWTTPQRACAYAAGPGVVSSAVTPVPLADRQGNLHIFHLRFFNMHELEGEARAGLLHSVSLDGGQTWSEQQQIDYGHAYTGSLNSALLMDSGRMLVPLSYLDPERSTARYVSKVVYSDDNGQSWGISNDVAVESGGAALESGAVEPVVVQFAAPAGSPTQGLVWMVIRTQRGYFWESFSNDGAIWTPPHETRIVSSNAPGGVVRLRDGRVALFWNNLFGEPFSEGVSYARQYLYGAISANDGQTWSRPKVVAQRRAEEPFKAQTTYPFPCQAPDGAIVLFYHRIYGQPDRNWRHPGNELIRVDPAWLADV